MPREAKVETRKVFNAERKALQVMGLGADATLEIVKAKYKALVKQHHPDANGGDRSTEDRLIEIIKAYNYLKTVVRGTLDSPAPAGSPNNHGALFAWGFSTRSVQSARPGRSHAGGGSPRSRGATITAPPITAIIQ